MFKECEIIPRESDYLTSGQKSTFKVSYFDIPGQRYDDLKFTVKICNFFTTPKGLHYVLGFHCNQNDWIQIFSPEQLIIRETKNASKLKKICECEPVINLTFYFVSSRSRFALVSSLRILFIIVNKWLIPF